MADSTEEKKATTSWKWESVLKSAVTSAVAIAIAVVYLKFSWQIYQDFAVNKPAEGSNWDRAMVIYGTITSVGFAAIGVLLGTTVQQVNVGRAIEERDRARGSIIETEKLIQEGESGGSPAVPGGDSALHEAKMREIRRTLLAGL